MHVVLYSCYKFFLVFERSLHATAKYTKCVRAHGCANVNAKENNLEVSATDWCVHTIERMRAIHSGCAACINLSHLCIWATTSSYRCCLIVNSASIASWALSSVKSLDSDPGILDQCCFLFGGVQLATPRQNRQ